MKQILFLQDVTMKF